MYQPNSPYSVHSIDLDRSIVEISDRTTWFVLGDVRPLNDKIDDAGPADQMIPSGKRTRPRKELMAWAPNTCQALHPLCSTMRRARRIC